MLDWHISLLQSQATLHTFESMHLGHVGPPQSTSVSSWFRKPSLQSGSEEVRQIGITPLARRNSRLQMFDEQNPLRQSVATLHVLPATHFWQIPPQSVSVSWAFLNPSLQLGAMAEMPWDEDSYHVIRIFVKKAGGCLQVHRKKSTVRYNDQGLDISALTVILMSAILCL